MHGMTLAAALSSPVIDTRRLWTTVIERWWGGRADGVFSRRFEALDLLRA